MLSTCQASSIRFVKHFFQNINPPQGRRNISALICLRRLEKIKNAVEKWWFSSHGSLESVNKITKETNKRVSSHLVRVPHSSSHLTPPTWQSSYGKGPSLAGRQAPPELRGPGCCEPRGSQHDSIPGRESIHHVFFGGLLYEKTALFNLRVYHHPKETTIFKMFFDFQGYVKGDFVLTLENPWLWASKNVNFLSIHHPGWWWDHGITGGQ